VDSWIEVLQGDKHEIFRAAHDASVAVDYLLTLELSRSLSPGQLYPGPTLGATGVAVLDLQVSRDIVHAKGNSQILGDYPAHSLSAAEAIVAKFLGASAKLQIPQVEGGIYRGVILGETPHYIVQRQSRQVGIAHRKDSLDGQLQVGAYVRIQYVRRNGMVRTCCERARAAERGR
jgi:hypothetical protein